MLFLSLDDIRSLIRSRIHWSHPCKLCISYCCLLQLILQCQHEFRSIVLDAISAIVLEILNYLQNAGFVSVDLFYYGTLLIFDSIRKFLSIISLC